MSSIARRLLDELMGPDRNKPLWLQGQSQVRYTQAEVCKYYLVGFCPHELFLNTKSDIGQCPWRLHDPLIKDEFDRRGDPAHREAYERSFHSKCWELVKDLERKLKRGKERLDVPDQAVTGNEEVEEKRVLLEHQYKEALAEVERLGDEGRVREAEERMVQSDLLKGELDRLKQLEADNPLYRLEKKMELCPTCGAFLIVNDAPMRIQAHYAGRQHNGWVQLRNSLEKYKATKRPYGEEHNNRLESRRDERRGSTDAHQQQHYGRDSQRQDYHRQEHRSDRGRSDYNRPSEYRSGRRDSRSDPRADYRSNHSSHQSFHQHSHQSSYHNNSGGHRDSHSSTAGGHRDYQRRDAYGSREHSYSSSRDRR